jgi:hypothetical protein
LKRRSKVLYHYSQVKADTATMKDEFPNIHFTLLTIPHFTQLEFSAKETVQDETANKVIG